MKNKHFGKISSVLIFLIMTVSGFIFKINLLYFETTGAIPIYCWITLLIVFYLLMLLKAKIATQVLTISFLGLILISFPCLFSAFQSSITPDDYESMYDWGAAFALAWMVFLPIILVILFMQGLLFDLIMKWRLSKYESKK